MFDEKAVAILKVRAKVLQAARCWLDQNGYVEAQGPTLIPAVGEWPGHFEVKFFDKKAYLTQGLQPYANVFVASMGKVYTVAPTFRAEKLTSKRHLAEYWRIEVAQKGELDSIIDAQEKLITHVCHTVVEESPQNVECCSRSVEDLAKVQAPFYRITYDEAVEMLQRDGFDVCWGQRFDWELEKQLSLKFTQPFFITKFPMGMETIFLKSDPKMPELTMSADLLAPEGYGEISSGAQRITEKRILLRKMAEENIDPADQKWYLNFVSNDSFAHSGFAIGVERLVQWICKLVNIVDATAFPRLHDSPYP
jgi:asparaginyl-tRNA synthetase